MYRAQSIRIGLGLLAVALVLEYGTGFAQNSLGQGTFVYIILLGALGVSGFAFLVLSTFLPRGKRERPTFTQEHLGREGLQYGVYTEGNWKSVLDEKDKEEKARRRG
jgi:hypothetical protein